MFLEMISFHASQWWREQVHIIWLTLAWLCLGSPLVSFAAPPSSGHSGVTNDFTALAAIYMDKGDRTNFLADDVIFPGLLSEPEPVAEYIIRMIREQDSDGDYQTMRNYFRADEDAWQGFYTLNRVRYARRNPLRSVQVAGLTADSIKRLISGKIYNDIVRTVAPLIDIEMPVQQKTELPCLSKPESVADFCLSVLNSAAIERDRAFCRYSKEELAFVYSQSGRFLRKLVDHVYLSVPYFKDRQLFDKLYSTYEDVKAAKKNLDSAKDVKTREDAEKDLSHAIKARRDFYDANFAAIKEDELFYTNNVQLLNLTRKTDYAALARMADCLTVFLRPDIHAAIRAALANAGTHPPEQGSGIKGDIILYRETPFGPIVIGGPGDNKFSRNCAVIIDIGGDDTYENNAGASYSVNNPFGVVIDYAGNDKYLKSGEETEQSFGQGAGVCGCGLLVDLGGNDTYDGVVGTQGFGFLGAGILYDNEGDDCYRAHEWSQGAGMFGFGILMDTLGSDKYEGRSYCQAFASTKGVGLLLDVAGNDWYFCGGYHGSMFGTKGAFDGHAQGCAMGLRSMAPDRPASAQGGIALLLDMAGDDIYKGGEFSQGLGYFYAMGMLFDCGGNDTYVSERFGSGAGVHSGVGILVDEGTGNDIYTGKGANSLGAGWDLGLGILSDQGGDDNYECEWLGLGSGAQNGIGILLDHAGVDNYRARGMSLGYGGKNDYRGGNSLGMLIDANSAGDRYAAKRDIAGKKENTTVKTPRTGLFHDTPDPMLQK